MANDIEIRVGDWVRFYRSGQMVIGEVRYIIPRQPWERSGTLATDAGTVAADAVLEVRHGE